MAVCGQQPFALGPFLGLGLQEPIKGDLRVVGNTEPFFLRACQRDVYKFLSEHANIIGAAGTVATIAGTIIAKIIGVIRAKKHVKREPYQERIGQTNNTIIITNSQNVSNEMPLEVYEIFKAGTVDAD